MPTKLITFKTNHTILGDVVEGVSYTVVKHPVQVVSVPPQGPNETSSIAFSPFVEYAEEFRSGFQIKNEDILMISTPVRELANQYSKMFGSGIEIASSIPKL
jgi:hypothetical protein